MIERERERGEREQADGQARPDQTRPDTERRGPHVLTAREHGRAIIL